ncbi:MAG TPA: hypothetical protein VFA98_12840 [Thermoanaerobaculia bacterium]|nr:hypothetical protein [Thermoanaerobaculia bacterium]
MSNEVFTLFVGERARVRVRGSVIAALLICASAATLASPAPIAEVLGDWRGTSTCVKSGEFPSCRDEVVVYEFRKPSSEDERVALTAYKIVDGEKQLMGEFYLTWDAKQVAWTKDFQNERYHGLFTYVVHGDEITGTLVDLPSRHVIRNISVRREKPSTP